MGDAPRLDTLFHRDPTRDLEEVQKVGATDQAERDVEEFCETESARRVLERLSGVVSKSPAVRDPRFLYLHATFGSGKTHLLKLISYATGQTKAPASVVSDLSTRFEGFQHLRTAIEEAPTDRFVPVFLNLLDRDASAEPPIPVLIYEAIGSRLGYPTDPRWLLEFLLRLEEEAPETDVWAHLQDQEVGGRGLLDDRGRIRTWLYEAVPPVLGEAGVSCTQEEIQTWIGAAENAVSGGAFGAEDLRDRVEQVQSLLSRRSGQPTELLIGLDEIALFIGDERSRYEELRQAMRALIDGPNPVVLGTGQWALKTVHDDFVGDPDPEAWYSQEVQLEGADTETVVRRRWLQKKSQRRGEVEGAIAAMPDPPGALANGADSREDAVAAYPLRPGDLHWIREAMQSLLTGGRGAATEHIQGRALLVLVRALFVRRGWAKQELEAVVPWPDLFAVLQSETNLVPTWAEELLSRLAASAQDVGSPVEAVARTVFLLNKAEVPATEAAITYLLLDRVDASIEKRRTTVQKALGWLDDNNYVFEETDGQSATYRLLTEQEVSVAEKVAERAEKISYPRLRSTIMEWIREAGSLLMAPENRQEVAVGGERGVPLTFYYSILESVPDPSDEASTVALRILVEAEGEDSQIEDWVEKNAKGTSLEDGLIVVRLPPNFEQRLRRNIARSDVLQNETRHFPDLKSDQLQEQQSLRRRLRSALDDAQVVDAQSDKQFGTYADGLAPFVAEEVVGRKFPERRALARPLQPIDDGTVLARFFRGDAEWPLSDADARMLGIDVAGHGFGEGGWAQEFWSVAKDLASGTLLDGDQVLAMIEQRGGAFLGTSVEALQALLLVLATSETMQLRQGGTLVRDPKEMGRALRTKTQIRRLTIRLEPPPDRDEARRLRVVYRLLTGSEDTPDDTAEIVAEIVEWAQAHAGEVQSVQQFVDRNFENVAIQALTSRLKQAAASPSSVDAAAFAGETAEVEAKSFRRAYRLCLGEASGLWEQFVEARGELTTSAPMATLTQVLEDVTQQQEVPEPSEIGALVRLCDHFDLWQRFVETRDELVASAPTASVTQELREINLGQEIPEPSTVRSLIQKAEKYQKQDGPGEGGEGEGKGNGTSEGNGSGVGNESGGGGGESGSDGPDEMKKRLENLCKRLDQEAEGRIVLIEGGQK